MTQDKTAPGPVVLVRFTLAEEPDAQAYYLARRAIAERFQETAAPGDRVEILPRGLFAVGAAVPPGKIGPGELHLVGVQRPDGRWVQPPGTGHAARRN